MKRFLLPIIAGALSLSASAQVENAVAYGYCGDNINGIGVQMPKIYYAAAFKMTDEDTRKYDGCEVVGISVGMGSLMKNQIDLFLTEDLMGTPFYTQQGRTKPQRWNDIELLTPYKIEAGKPFYVGYTYYCASSTAYPVGFDGQTDNHTEESDWIAFSDSEETLLESWQHYGKGGGNACIRVLLRGENLSTRNAIPTQLEFPDIVTPGTDFEFSLHFINTSTEAVNSLQVQYQLGTDPVKTMDVTLDTPVPSNASGSVTFTDNCTTDEIGLPCWAVITKVNGEANDAADRKVNAAFNNTTGLWKRQIVLEEATGTHCGYCPRGLYTIEQLSKKYPDEFIAIGIHSYSSADPMGFPSAYSGFVSQVDGYPYCQINRLPRTYTTNPEIHAVENALLEMRDQAMMLNVEASVSNVTSSGFDATATVQAAKDYENVDYAVTFVLIEDFVGPYMQLNNYANSGNSMPGWSDNKGWVNYTYNDVAREVTQWNGIPESAFTSIAKGEEKSYTHRGMPFTRVDKRDNCQLVALLLNRKTGEILDASRVPVNPEKYPGNQGTGVGELTDGAEAPATYYNLSGVRVEEPLGPGLYIRVQGGERSKILVK